MSAKTNERIINQVSGVYWADDVPMDETGDLRDLASIVELVDFTYMNAWQYDSVGLQISMSALIIRPIDRATNLDEVGGNGAVGIVDIVYARLRYTCIEQAS